MIIKKELKPSSNRKFQRLRKCPWRTTSVLLKVITLDSPRKSPLIRLFNLNLESLSRLTRLMSRKVKFLSFLVRSAAILRQIASPLRKTWSSSPTCLLRRSEPKKRWSQLKLPIQRPFRDFKSWKVEWSALSMTLTHRKNRLPDTND